MTDPYEILGLAGDADEAETRRRYLELVRQYPPDRAPERFAAIRAAYEQVRDPVRRMKMLILQPSTPDSVDALIADLRGRLKADLLPLDVLLALAEIP